MKLFSIIFLFLFSSTFLQAYVQPIQKPSDKTLDEIQQENRFSQDQLKATKDWWDEGPPTEGEGGGGFVGAPVDDSLPFILFTATIYLIYMNINDRKKNNH